MAAPAGVGSGSAPEPVTPESAAAEPVVPPPAEPQIPEPSQPVLGESVVGAEDQEPDAMEPDAMEPDAMEPDAMEPDAMEPDAAEPAAAEPDEQARPARGVGRLVAAAVVLVVIAAAAAAGVLYVTTHGFRSKTLVTYRPAAVFSLRAGDCINSSQNGLSATILPCATPHDAEVFATFSLTGSGWPGGSAVQQQASTGCANRIAGYLNPQLLNAGLIQEYVYPNHEAWQAGVRTVVCEVSSSTGPLTGSVRQSG